MKIKSIELTGNEHNLYFLGDLHVGHASCRLDLIRKMVKEIASDKKASVILLGDMIDCITHNDKKRFNPAEIDNENFKLKDLADLPKKQADLFLKIIEPIKSKVILAVAGNHETSVAKHNTFDVYGYYCEEIGLDHDAKLGVLGLAKIKFKFTKTTSTSKTIAVQHGIGGGGFREGYALNHVMDLFRKYGTDISVMGHIHRLSCAMFEYIDVSLAGKLVKRKRFFGSTGSFMDSIQEDVNNYFEVSKGMIESPSILVYNIKYANDSKGLVYIEKFSSISYF